MKDDRTITEIKSRAASLVPLLVDLSRYKKDGGSHVRGPCPWKPTSDGLAFRLDLQTGGWAYFVAEGQTPDGTGDILSLVQKVRNMDFPAAKLWAAEKLGIQVENNGHPGGHGPGTSGRPKSHLSPENQGQKSPLIDTSPATGTAVGTKPSPPPEPDGPAPVTLQPWLLSEYGLDIPKERWLGLGIVREEHSFKILNKRKVDSLKYPIKLPGGGRTYRNRSLQRFNGKRLPDGAYGSGFQAGAFDPENSLEGCAGDTLVVTGGEEKCLALLMAGFMAISTACGEKPEPPISKEGYRFVDLIIEAAPAEVVVVFDVYAPMLANGKVNHGQWYAARFAKSITDQTGIPARFVKWPEGLHDGHDLNNVAKTKDGLAQIAALINGAKVPEPKDLPPENTPQESEQPSNPRRTIQTRKWTVNEIEEAQFQPEKFLVKGFIPEVGLAMIAANPKIGKSWMALQLAIAVANGGYFLCDKNMPCEKGAAIYYALEDNPRRMQKRLASIKKSTGPAAEIREQVIFVFETGTMAEAGTLDSFEQVIRETPGVRVVVIDTLQRFRGPAPKITNAYEHDVAAMAKLQTIAFRYGILILLIHHLTKGAHDDPFSRTSGSAGITGACDFMAIIDRQRGEKVGVMYPSRLPHVDLRSGGG